MIAPITTKQQLSQEQHQLRRIALELEKNGTDCLAQLPQLGYTPGPDQPTAGHRPLVRLVRNEGGLYLALGSYYQKPIKTSKAVAVAA